MLSTFREVPSGPAKGKRRRVEANLGMNLLRLSLWWRSLRKFLWLNLRKSGRKKRYFQFSV